MSLLYKDRVIAEQVELGRKIVRLDKFIESDEFKVITGLERSRLKLQRLLMKLYHDVLIDRIDDF